MSYHCEVCNKSFDHKNEFIRHAWRHSDRKQHKCQQCDKSFVDKHKLRDHARTHAGEKPYECSVCGRTFAQKLGLDIHARTHTGKKPFQCTNCERSFADQSNLRNHLRSHTGERTHECAECGKVFGTGFRFKRHMRIHTGEKPYQCSECGKAFTNSENLRVHMIVHTGERKHKCPICDKTFAQKSALNTHKLTHTGEKPHECIQCGKRFVQRAHLKKHLKFSCPSTKHRDAEIFSCYVCHVLFSDPTREGGNSGVPKREMCMKCCDALRRGETLGNLRESSKTHQPSSELLKTSFTAETSPAIRAQMKVGKGKSNESGITSRTQSQLSGTCEDDVNGYSENSQYETENKLDNVKGWRLDIQASNRDNHRGRFKSDEKHDESLVDRKGKRKNSDGDNFQKNLRRSVSGENKLVVNSIKNLLTQNTAGQSTRGVNNLEATSQTGYTNIRNREYDSDDSDDGIADFPFLASDLENICEEDYDSDKTIDLDLWSNNDDFRRPNSTADNSGDDCFKGTKSENVTINEGNVDLRDVRDSSDASANGRSVSENLIEEHVSDSDGDGSDSDRTIDMNVMTLSDDDANAMESSANSNKSDIVCPDSSKNVQKKQKQCKRNDKRKSAKYAAVGNKKNENVLLYQCLECNKIFSLAYGPEGQSVSELQFCPRCKTSTEKAIDFVTQVRKLKKEKSFKCVECDKEYGQKNQLLRHAWIHCDIKPYQCDQCDMSFSQNNKLMEHMRKHTRDKPFQCDLCEKTFSQKQSLDYHTRLHKGEKPHQCSTCGSAFADMTSLKIHTLIHSNEKSHECTECGKAFGTGFRLKRHMRIHTGEKPYQCSECGKAFTKSEYLRVHMMVHTGERKHKCPVCDKTFSQKSALNTHKLTHTGEKPHECIQCGKRFVQKAHLKKHLKFSCPSK